MLSAFEDEENYLSNPPSDAYIASCLARDDDFVELVARSGAKIIGALSGYVLRKFEAERAELYIYDIAVDAEFRRRGVATALIEALKPTRSRSRSVGHLRSGR